MNFHFSVRFILFSIIRIRIERVEMFLLIISVICFIMRTSLYNFEEFHIDYIILKAENLRSKCYLEWKTWDEQSHPGGKFELVKMQRLIWRHGPDLIIFIRTIRENLFNLNLINSKYQSNNESRRKCMSVTALVNNFNYRYSFNNWNVQNWRLFSSCYWRSNKFYIIHTRSLLFEAFRRNRIIQ